MAIKFPRCVADITAAWMTAALNKPFPGTEVTSLAIGTVIHGTATKVRLLMSYNEIGHQHRLPPTMWFKGGLESHSQDEGQIAVYAGEVSFYSEISPKLMIEHPRAYAAETDPNARCSYLILEDLLARNATFCQPNMPISVRQAARIVDYLAGLHASHWGMNGLKENTAFSGGGPLLKGGVIDGLLSKENWEACLQLPRAAFLIPPLRDRDMLRDLMLKMLRCNVQQGQCLVHGDTHLGNAYFLPDGQPGFLDWQTTMYGHWAHDFAEFITISLTIDDRRANEHQLLSRYIEVLKEHNAILDFDEAWLEYRRHALYNLVWALCPIEWQSEAVCKLNTERACKAVLDLKTLDAWDD